MRSYSLLIVLVLLLLGCGEEALLPSPIEAGAGYYPVGTNQTWLYDVEEINISLAGSDTIRYQLKEVLIDSFLNQSSEITYRLEREKDFLDGAGFKFDEIWTVTKTNQHVVVNESNLGLLKMVFPVIDGQEWDGNSFNGERESFFSMKYISADTTINSDTYADVLRVTLADIPQNLTGIDERYEYYAPNVGLVAKDYTTLKYCTKDCTADFVIEGGNVLRQSLVSYDPQ
jgi:hypothetical protein